MTKCTRLALPKKEERKERNDGYLIVLIRTAPSIAPASCILHPASCIPKNCLLHTDYALLLHQLSFIAGVGLVSNHAHHLLDLRGGIWETAEKGDLQKTCSGKEGAREPPVRRDRKAVIDGTWLAERLQIYVRKHGRVHAPVQVASLRRGSSLKGIFTDAET